MIDPESKEIITFRLKESTESLSDASILFRNGSYRSSINRAYYAMFYSVTALLVNKGISTSKHSGAIACFDKEYVMTKIFGKELSKSLHRAFELRQESDYAELNDAEEEDASLLLQDATEFVNQIKNYIEESIFK